MNSQLVAMNKTQYAFDFNHKLLAGLKQGEKDAILKMGIEAFNADKLGFAMTFFKLAEQKGHPDASEFIHLIREIVRKK